LSNDLHTPGFQRIQRRNEFIRLLSRHLHQQDTGEFAGQRHHAAFGPVAVVTGDDIGQSLNNAWVVVTDDGQNN